MVCHRRSGRMYEEQFIVAGNVVTDLACHLCGMRDSPEIRKNRAEVASLVYTKRKQGRPIGPCGAYRRNIDYLNESP